MAGTSKANGMDVGLHTVLATIGWNSESIFLNLILSKRQDWTAGE